MSAPGGGNRYDHAETLRECRAIMAWKKAHPWIVRTQRCMCLVRSVIVFPFRMLDWLLTWLVYNETGIAVGRIYPEDKEVQ